MWHSVELGDVKTDEERRVILSSTLYMIEQTLRNDVRDLEIVMESANTIDSKVADSIMTAIIRIKGAIKDLDDARNRLKGGS